MIPKLYAFGEQGFQDRFLEPDGNAVFRDVALQEHDPFQNAALLVFEDLAADLFHFLPDMPQLPFFEDQEMLDDARKKFERSIFVAHRKIPENAVEGFVMDGHDCYFCWR